MLMKSWFFILSLFLSIILILVTRPAFCFPEMARHGYVNCISCHVSPTGGGTLTPYGRQLSREVLSHFGKEGEEQFLYNAVSLPEWLLAGGDFRAIQLYRNTPVIREARVIPMQVDLEAAALYKNFSVDATVGPQEAPQTQPPQDTLFSRRHFIAYRPSDTTSIRAGKFFPAFGINLPDHAVVTKRGLGWNENGETYNLEFAYLGDAINIYGTGIFGRPDFPTLNRETGGALNTSYFFSDRYKVGLSYFYGTNNTVNRHLTGPFAILGFTPHFFLLSEIDLQNYLPKDSVTPVQWGLVDYERLDYEFFQGFHGFLTQEYSQLDFQASNTINRFYGLGVQYFPRPHFEFQLFWQKQQIIATSSDYIDFACLLFHFYL